MSHTLQTAAPSLTTPPQTGQAPSQLRVRGRAASCAATLREALPMVLAACGCAGLVRREGPLHSTLIAELPLESALAVYGRLVQEGLLFSPKSHMDWAHVCTLQAFASTTNVPPRTIQLCLELARAESAERPTRLRAGYA